MLHSKLRSELTFEKFHLRVGNGCVCEDDTDGGGLLDAVACCDEALC